MHTLLLAGLLLSSAASYVLASGLFVRAWRQRRAESEYLVFGLATLGIAGYTGFVGLITWCATRPDLPHLSLFAVAANASAIAAIALLIHFALRYARVAQERKIAAFVYAAAVFFLVILGLGRWFTALPRGVVPMVILGFEVSIVQVDVTPLASLFYASVPVAGIAVCALVGRTWLRQGRREGAAAFIGSAIAAVALMNDALALGVGQYDSIAMTPYGFGALVFGVAFTVTSRYGRLAAELEERTEQLKRRSEQLSSSIRELERTEAQLVRREQLAVVGELVTALAEEVRKPIAEMGGALNVLRSPDGNGSSSAQLATVEAGVDRLERLVNDLLDYARPINPERHPAALKELLAEALEVAAGKSITTYLACDGEWPLLLADRDLLRRVFDDLFANAVQAMPRGGRLEVRVSVEDGGSGGWVIIRVSDSGEGMDEPQRKMALSPLFTTRPDGTGLGLPICARIVEAHGGRLGLESRRGEGTTVNVALPQGPAGPADDE